MCHRYDIFDMKKAEYDKQIFEIETSLQYIDDMKKRIIENQSLEELNLQFDQTKQLKNIKSQVSSILSFERLIVGVAVFVYALLSFHQSVWTSVVALTAMSGLLAIHFSVIFRVFLYKMYQKLKK